MVSTPLKNISQNGNLPQFSGWTFKKIFELRPNSFLIHQQQKWLKHCALFHREVFHFFQFRAEKNPWGRGFFKPYGAWFWCRGRDRLATDRAFFPSLKLTAIRTWKWMVGIWSFLFGKPGLFSGRLLLVSGSVHAASIRYSGVFLGSFQWVLLEISWTQENYGNKTLKPYEHIHIFLD